MNDISGIYISSSGLKLPFEIGAVGDRFIISLEGRSKGVANVTADRAPGWKGAVGSAFWVTTDEFENFRNNVLDKNIEWQLGETIVPGIWASC